MVTRSGSIVIFLLVVKACYSTVAVQTAIDQVDLAEQQLEHTLDDKMVNDHGIFPTLSSNTLPSPSLLLLSQSVKSEMTSRRQFSFRGSASSSSLSPRSPMSQVKSSNQQVSVSIASNTFQQLKSSAQSLAYPPSSSLPQSPLPSLSSSSPVESLPSSRVRSASMPTSPTTVSQLLKLFNNTDTGPESFLPDGTYNMVTIFDPSEDPFLSAIMEEPSKRPFRDPDELANVDEDQIIPQCYRRQHQGVKFTMYWVPKEGEWDETDDGQRILLDNSKASSVSSMADSMSLFNGDEDLLPLLSPNDLIVAMVSRPLWKKCRMEGTCLLADGSLINLAPGYTNRFLVIGHKDRTENIFGWGSGLINLQPYVSVASNDVPLHQTLYVRELKGMPLGNGMVHNGCVRVDDDSWSYGGCQLDFFAVSYVDFLWLDRELGRDRVSVEPRNCTVLNYSTMDHLKYVGARVHQDTLSKVVNDTLSLTRETMAWMMDDGSVEE